jgi:spermidine/putrescine transport system permease protein
MADRPAGSATAPDRESRSALPDHVLLAAGGHLVLVLLVLPLAIVVVFSFGTRAKNGGYEPAFVFDNYIAPSRSPSRSSPASRWPQRARSAACSSGCRSRTSSRPGPARKSVLILLLVVPFWTSFLIRTYAWLLILGPDAGLAGMIGRSPAPSVQILGTPSAVMSASSTATCR